MTPKGANDKSQIITFLFFVLCLESLDSCPGGKDFINGQCPQSFQCTDDNPNGKDVSCNSQGICGATQTGVCDCTGAYTGIDCMLKPGKKIFT